MNDDKLCTHWVKPIDRPGVCTASLCNWQDAKGNCTIAGDLNRRPSSPRDYTSKTDSNRRPL
jgi:hypothetical protein